MLSGAGLHVLDICCICVRHDLGFFEMMLELCSSNLKTFEMFRVWQNLDLRINPQMLEIMFEFCSSELRDIAIFRV